MSAFIYEYRLAGEKTMHYVRASGDDVAVRGVLESRHQRKVELLMTTRTATPQDTFIQSAVSKQIAASWDRFVAKVTATYRASGATLASRIHPYRHRVKAYSSVVG